MTRYKYLLTFDIGIKNLAYCIVRYNILDKKNFDIIYWGILDISYKGLICDFNIDIYKKNNIAICCINNSYFYLPNNKNDKETKYISYCKSHSNKIKNNNITLYNQFKKIANNAKLKDNFNQQVERLLIELDKFYYQLIDTIYDIDTRETALQICYKQEPVKGMIVNPIVFPSYVCLSGVGMEIFNLLKDEIESPPQEYLNSVIKYWATQNSQYDFSLIEKTKLITNDNP